MMVLCDACGHLVYESDTLLINEIVTCEDCFTVGNAWPQGVSESGSCFSCGNHFHGQQNGLCLSCEGFSGIYHLGTQLAILGDFATFNLVSFAANLSLWRGRSLEEIGLAEIRDLLRAVSETGQLRSLIDRTKRMLDTDPDNTALRYLLVLARARNAKESDSNVLEETRVLLRIARSTKMRTDWLGFELMTDITGFRPDLAAGIASAMMADDEGLQFGRRLLAEKESLDEKVRLIAMNGIASNIAKVVSMTSRYYNSIALIVLSGAMNSALESVGSIDRFYNLDPSGEQDDR